MAISLAISAVAAGFLSVPVLFVAAIRLLWFSRRSAMPFVVALCALFAYSCTAQALSRRWWRKYDDLRSDRELCPKCGYNLMGNASGICPECGSSVGWIPAANLPPAARP